MIGNKHLYFERLETFLGKKYSASPDDTSYTYGGVGDVYQGEPDISWRSIVYIGDVKFFGTHGKIYDASGTSEHLKNPVKINGTDFDGSKDITTDSWGKPRQIMTTDGTNTSAPIPIDGSEDISLPLPTDIDANVTKDSSGRVITETYTTKEDLQDAFDELEIFNIYSGDDDSDPTLSSYPAIDWETEEEKNAHAGDYYVTSEGRVFNFINSPDTGEWVWDDITDFYLYNCLSELQEIKKKVDISGKWDKVPQTSVETDYIYVLGERVSGAYLDVLCCPQFVNYQLGFDTNIYFPFAYGGSWTRTITRYFKTPRLVRATDLSRISGKTIVVTNEESSGGILYLVLGNSPSGSSGAVTLVPGKACILTFKADISSGNLVYYWEYTEPASLGITSDWE